VLLVAGDEQARRWAFLLAQQTVAFVAAEFYAALEGLADRLLVLLRGIRLVN
jgi:hypothetical protein